MKNLPILFLLILFACNTTNPSNDHGGDKKESDPAEETQNYTRAKYENATVYAAATDYAFVTEEGERIMIRVSHVEPEGNPDINVNLIEVMEEVEGPPSADSNLVGKYFRLYKNEAGDYVKIELEE